MKELQPIRVQEQIQDAISGYRPPELDDKIRIVTDNVNRVIKINGSKVYRVTVEGEHVYYYLQQKFATQHYYPIKYARIVLDDAPVPPSAPACEHQDAEDGCCLHPDAITPECHDDACALMY